VIEAEPERVRALADDALTRADAVRAGLEDLLAAVERLRAAIADGGPAEAPAAQAPVTLDAARLVAIEMAVAGRGRDEVERHLQAVYGGPDTSELLDDVFGAAL
jgi:hypothetical protein